MQTGGLYEKDGNGVTMMALEKGGDGRPRRVEKEGDLPNFGVGRYGGDRVPGKSAGSRTIAELPGYF